MSLSGRTIARLAAPFEGGSGPSHGMIEGVWLSEDASEYLPDAGNKADRVRAGLKALRDGRVDGPNGPALRPDADRLRRVVEELAERLLSAGLVKEDDLPEAFGQAPADAPAAGPPRPLAPAPQAAAATVGTAEPIFMVHGHDNALLHQAVRVVERATSRKVVVLHEQANAGRTVVEKFEAHALAASFAVVLLTADDFGAANGGTPQARARQNVIFELGFFFGRLGRNRVAVLLAPGVEQPSDIAGLVYISVDQGGAWKYALSRELAASGIPVAFEQIP